MQFHPGIRHLHWCRHPFCHTKKPLCRAGIEKLLATNFNKTVLSKGRMFAAGRFFGFQGCS
jgi:hypothetical protein